MCAQPARCMHAKSSLTSAYRNLFCFLLRPQKFYSTNVQLSQLMLNLYVVIRAGSFLRYAVENAVVRPSLCVFIDLYVPVPIPSHFKHVKSLTTPVNKFKLNLLQFEILVCPKLQLKQEVNEPFYKSVILYKAT